MFVTIKTVLNAVNVKRRIEMQTTIEWFDANWGLVAGIWLLTEQILANTSLKSNSTFQIVCNLIDSIVKMTTKPKTGNTTQPVV